MDKPYNVLASNQITIQVVDDVALYKAVLSSSVGELIDPSIDTVTITLNVFRNFEDITNKFTKIVWKRYIYDLDVPILDPQWGADLQGQKTITINTDDFNNKLKIECKVYDIITGEERMIAGTYIVLTDVKDLRPSKVPPTNPKDHDVWLDTSVEPPVLKIYVDGKWVTVNDNKYVYDDIDKLTQDLNNINGKVDDINQEMGNFSLLNIDNKKDYLLDYTEHLTTTNAISPNPDYKCNLSKTKFKFKGSVYLTTYSNQKLLYNNINFSTNKFSINMWISPGDTITSSNELRLISTGDEIDKTMLTLWNNSPTGSSDGQNIRFVAEFGNDDQGVRQYKELSHPERFEENKWYMLTITYDGSKKTFDFYRNGEYWNSYTINKLNAIKHFGMIKSGWYVENLAIVNDIKFEVKDVKFIYSKNRPFKDLYPKLPHIPNVNNIQMTIS